MVRRERLLGPVEGPRDGLLPERVLLVAERRVHLGLPGLVLGPVGAKVLDLGPVANREAGGVGRAEGGRLGNLRADDRDTQDVRLELHEQVVEDHAAVDLEGRQRNAGVGVPLTALKVDGGMVFNNLLMQFQSDVLGVPVIRPKVAETTALGAAYAAGLAVGYWAEVEDLRANWAKDKTWEPKMDAALRDKEYALWKKAVTRTFDWAE